MNTAEDFIILQGHVYQHNKKNNRTLQTRKIKKFPLFSEHTSYFSVKQTITWLIVPNEEFFILLIPSI